MLRNWVTEYVRNENASKNYLSLYTQDNIYYIDGVVYMYFTSYRTV